MSLSRQKTNIGNPNSCGLPPESLRIKDKLFKGLFRMNLLQNAMWSSAINFSDLWIMFAVTEKHYLPQNFIYAKKNKNKQRLPVAGAKDVFPCQTESSKKTLNISTKTKGTVKFVWNLWQLVFRGVYCRGRSSVFAVVQKCHNVNT